MKTKYEENENEINKEINQRIQDMKNIEENLKKSIEEKAHSIYVSIYRIERARRGTEKKQYKAKRVNRKIN